MIAIFWFNAQMWFDDLRLFLMSSSPQDMTNPAAMWLFISISPHSVRVCGGWVPRWASTLQTDSTLHPLLDFEWLLNTVCSNYPQIPNSLMLKLVWCVVWLFILVSLCCVVFIKKGLNVPLVWKRLSSSISHLQQAVSVFEDFRSVLFPLLSFYTGESLDLSLKLFSSIFYKE